MAHSISEKYRDTIEYRDIEQIAEIPFTIEQCLSEHSGPDTDKLHKFSPLLARKLNDKQPDVVGATVLYNLSLWQRNNYKQTLLEGRRYSFRSLSELREDLPYLSRSAIHKALIRLENKLGNQFLIKRDKNKLWFSIGERILNKQKGDKCLGFSSLDAYRLDDIRSAVILNNLRYGLSVYKKPKEDGLGNRYAKLTPSVLAPLLGFSEDTVGRALQKMRCAGGPLLQHPSDSAYYALRREFWGQADVPNVHVADVHSETAVVHGRTAEVHMTAADVHDYPGTDVNECINQYGKKDIKGYINSRSASQTRVPQSSLALSSKGLIFLEQLGNKELRRLRSSPPKVAASFVKSPRVPGSQLPYDSVAGDHELVYDMVTISSSDLPYDDFSQLYTVKEWISEEIGKVTFSWRIDKFPYDKDDITTLRRYFALNQHYKLSDSPLLSIYREMRDLQYGNVFGPPTKPAKNKFDGKRIARKTRTAKAFLKNLPKIVVQLYKSPVPDGETITYWGDIPHPYNTINYAYLDRLPKGVVACFDDELPTVELVDDQHQPVFN